MTKPTIKLVRPVKTQISLLICRSVWWSHVPSSLWAIQRGMNKNPCHTGWKCMLIWIFAGHTGLIVGFVSSFIVNLIIVSRKHQKSIPSTVCAAAACPNESFHAMQHPSIQVLDSLKRCLVPNVYCRRHHKWPVIILFWNTIHVNTSKDIGYAYTSNLLYWVFSQGCFTFFLLYISSKQADIKKSCICCNPTDRKIENLSFFTFQCCRHSTLKVNDKKISYFFFFFFFLRRILVFWGVGKNLLVFWGVGKSVALAEFGKSEHIL